MMSTSNRRAFELEETGHSVIVLCAECDRQVWTDDACYDETDEVWYCPDCAGVCEDG